LKSVFCKKFTVDDNVQLIHEKLYYLNKPKRSFENLFKKEKRTNRIIWMILNSTRCNTSCANTFNRCTTNTWWSSKWNITFWICTKNNKLFDWERKRICFHWTWFHRIVA